ncbi:hypothetical protein FOA52_005459 [Chlamydomonas sp. UWO 241]|nr:hypothetical protein FOA52_005459 [Chlamydomonas sp. UWO 241]
MVTRLASLLRNSVRSGATQGLLTGASGLGGMRALGSRAGGGGGMLAARQTSAACARAPLLHRPTAASGAWAAARGGIGVSIHRYGCSTPPAVVARAGRKAASEAGVSGHRDGCSTLVARAGRKAVSEVGGADSKPSRSKKVHTPAEDKVAGNAVMSEGVATYWAKQMEHIVSPQHKVLLANLDPTHPVGIRGRPVRSDDADGKGVTVPLLPYYVEMKGLYPRYVVLVKIGEFYETCGRDALLLCHFHRVNPMAPNSGVARSGTPVKNMMRAVRDLNEAGLGVVVCDEVKNKEPGAKDRKILGVSTPTNPMILADAAEDGCPSDEYYTESSALMGIASSKAGYALFEYKHELGTVFVNEQLTIEALVSQLEAQHAGCLLLHRSVAEVASGGNTTTRVTKAIQSYAGKRIPTHWYGIVGDASTLHGFVIMVRSEMNMPDEPIREVHVVRGDRPRPPYLSTITNLGLDATPGMPSLMDALLPTHTPINATHWVETLLRQPPPPAIARKLQQATRALSHGDDVQPRLDPQLSTKKVSEVLQSRQGHETFFIELTDMLQPFLDMLDDPKLGGPDGLTGGILSYVLWELQLLGEFPIDADGTGRKDLRDAVAEALQHVRDVVILDGSANNWPSVDEDEDEEGGVDGYAVVATPTAAAAAAKKAKAKRPLRDVLLEQADAALVQMERKNERMFLGRVKERVVAKELAEVARLRGVVARELRKICDELGKRTEVGLNPPKVVYDLADRAVYLRIGTGSKALPVANAMGLIPPINRKEKQEPNGRTSEALMAAVAAYRDATDDALEAVRQSLRALCDTLIDAGSLPALVVAAQSSIVGFALVAHTTEARRRGWCVPQLESESEVKASKSSGSTPRLEVSYMVPYWTEETDALTVPNDLVIDRMILLTGPNMAGKSTVLRSVMAVALLGCCGLQVPAASARIPFYDVFMVRNFSGDSPLEGLSSFGLECQEMRAVARDATARSLVLLDEMGKGTEVDSATCLSQAFLEYLSSTGSSVMFATHLRDLVAGLAPLEQAGRVINMCMETEERMVSRNGRKQVRTEPTWRIVPGVHDPGKTLAMQVALDQGVEASIVDRASDLLSYKHMLDRAQQIKQSEQMQEPVLRDSGSNGGGGGGRGGGVQGEEGVLAAEAPAGLSRSGADGDVDGGGGEGEAEEAEGVEEAVVEQAPLRSLQDAADVVAALMRSSAPAGGADSSGGGADTSGGPTLHFVHRHTQPPPRHSNQPVVYVVRWSNGMFYVGESGTISKRLVAHSTRSKAHPYKGPHLTAFYVVLPESDRAP